MRARARVCVCVCVPLCDPVCFLKVWATSCELQLFSPHSSPDKQSIKITQEGEVAESLQGALASLEQATDLGDRLVVPHHGPPSPPSHAVVTPRRGAPAAGTRTSGVVEATGEAMLRLAKLCEVLSSGDAELDAGAAGGQGEGRGGGRGRGREELAALAVKEYLRAMAAG